MQKTIQQKILDIVSEEPVKNWKREHLWYFIVIKGVRFELYSEGKIQLYTCGILVSEDADLVRLHNKVKGACNDHDKPQPFLTSIYERIKK